MRTFLTLITMPFTTLAVALIFNDFYIGTVLAVGLGFAAYMFWDKFVGIMEAEKNGK